MRFSTWGHAALLLALVASVGSAAQGRTGSGGARNAGNSGGNGSRQAQPGNFDEEMDQAELASYNSGGGGCNGECGNCCDAGGWGLAGMMNRPIQIVAGAQYLYARADFSYAPAYVTSDAVNAVDTFHQFDYQYNSSYNIYGGINLCDCGGQVLFNFTRLNSEANFDAEGTNNVQVFTPYEIDGKVHGHSGVDLKAYDLSFAKTIPLGCPLACGGGCGDKCCEDDCCEDTCCSSGKGGGCGCGWCPAWDIQWSGGVRFADVDWNRGTTAFDAANNNAVIDSANTVMNFQGFGGRVGLLGRRYIGRRGLFSLYGKGDWSLLLGDIDYTTTVTNDAGSARTTTSCRHIVPVTEVELGGTAHLGCHASLSAGYFWAAWHDLGMRDQYSGFANTFQTGSYDTANILGFDGLFARFQFNF